LGSYDNETQGNIILQHLQQRVLLEKPPAQPAPHRGTEKTRAENPRSDQPLRL
jgi:hypothetical protein